VFAGNKKRSTKHFAKTANEDSRVNLFFMGEGFYFVKKPQPGLNGRTNCNAKLKGFWKLFAYIAK
jgi:hypothetical protein